MTGSGAERAQRGATRPAHVRFGLRVLAIGGLAGAAWLLSAASAHAAEAAPLAAEAGPLAASALAADAPLDLSVVPLVDGAILKLPPVAEALASTVAPPGDAATSPALIPPPAAGPGWHSSPRVAPAVQPSIGSDRAGSGDSVSGGVVHGLIAPLGIADRLAGPTGPLTPLTRVVDSVVAPLDGVLRPVTGLLLTAAEPVTSVLGSVTEAALGPDLVPPPVRDLIPGAAPVPGGEVWPPGIGPAATPAARTGGLTEVSTGSAASERRYAGAEPRSAGSQVGRPIGGDPPRRSPVPLSTYPGAGAAIPAHGAGSHSDGGAIAAVLSSVVASTVAFHRLPITTDVAVLRQMAEDPTISPD
jgi:hypothetical protein